MPETDGSLPGVLIRALARSDWQRRRRALPAIGAFCGVAALSVLGVAAPWTSGSPPAQGHVPTPDPAAVTSAAPGYVPPRPLADPGLASPAASPASGAGSAGARPDQPAPADGGGAPGGQPAEPDQPAGPEAFRMTSVPLTIDGGYTARLYVGQLDHLIRRLEHMVTFQTSSSLRANRPQQCAMTVVISGVSGSQGAVYARGLGSGWTGAESEPDQRVATDAGVLHQQLVTPPRDAAAGKSWTGSAALHVDGAATAVTADYRLAIETVSGSLRTLTVANGSPIECRIY